MADLGEVPVPSAGGHADAALLRGDVDGVIQRKDAVQIHAAATVADHGILDIRVPVVPLNRGLRDLGAGSKGSDDSLEKFRIACRAGPGFTHGKVNVVVGKIHVGGTGKS